MFAAGCSDPVPPTTPTPAVPTITETFSDTLLVGGANTHQFLVTTIGGVKVTSAAVPRAAPVVLHQPEVSLEGLDGDADGRDASLGDKVTQGHTGQHHECRPRPVRGPRSPNRPPED